MADKVNLTVCFLWEDELRMAAKAMKALHALPDDAPDDERHRATADAFNSALVALWGLDDNHLCVMVGSGELNKRAKRTADSASGD